MKIKLLLSVMSLFAVASISLPSAQAQEAGSAPSQRWQFAPNYYKVEEATGPKHHYASYQPATRTVRTGSVPRGSAFLGINPEVLKPRPAAPAPIQQPVVTAQLQPANFNNAFGKPMTAAANPMPLTANPAAAMAPTKPVTTPHIAQSSPRHSSSNSRNVAGRVLRRPTAASMMSAPRALSYGQGNGYQQGINIPSANSGTGFGSSATVSGVIRGHR